MPGCLTHSGRQLTVGCAWMEPARDGRPGPRPHSASVQVRELSWQGRHNPCPQSKGLDRPQDSHRERRVEEPLSPAHLQALAQVDDLRSVQVLEMCVDTREHSLGNFGVHLPNLSQLKLTGSRLGSLRDLGTSLGHLQVLWLARCGLADLDGIGSFPVLKELYVSYNDISDLSPLCLLDQLEVLDLEGNSLEDLGQVRYLQLCPRLATLTLEGNMVCLQPAAGPANKAPRSYNYRAEVKKLIPQLRILDEVPTTCMDLPVPQELSQDWLMVKEAIKEGSMLDSTLPPLDHTHGATLQKHDPALTMPEALPWILSLLGPGGPRPEGLLSEDPAPEDHASNLTHGAAQVLCGNPTKGLRERRYQCQAWAPLEQLAPPRPGLAAAPPALRPDSTDSRDLVVAGLPAWRELGLRPLGSQQEGAATPQDPWKLPEQQEDQAGPRPSLGSPGLTSEPSRTLGGHLVPSPPKDPMPPDSASSSPRGSADLRVRRRRLRSLGSLGPGLSKGVAPVTTLKALEGASGPNLEPSDIRNQSQPWIQQPDPQPSATCGT
ncbi:PREDICTED: leucine-rich repeat-containing protein 56 [Chinchilla lanigera]|uniref:Leucine rich repeat containing 56 n=1 Tax=Chinchilla lanigera TaxID=34839 RepID=A0A8C2UUK5_CHILA|nr:PREDICTED: leucine-rich repeat-containing protein 56 [Chinchilla lanigera]